MYGTETGCGDQMKNFGRTVTFVYCLRLLQRNAACMNNNKLYQRRLLAIVFFGCLLSSGLTKINLEAFHFRGEKQYIKPAELVTGPDEDAGESMPWKSVFPNLLIINR